MPPADTSRLVTLVAMPDSGEVFIVRDDNGAVWLIQPPGAGDPELITNGVVERAVVDHGFERIEESFTSWAQLDAERQRRAGVGLTPRGVDVERFDSEDVAQVMRALQRCRRRGQIVRARRVAHRLLRAPVLQRDLGLYRGLVEFLEELDAIPPSPPFSVVDDASERMPARQRALSFAA